MPTKIHRSMFLAAAFGLTTLACLRSASAADTQTNPDAPKKVDAKKDNKKSAKWAQMDYGPFLSASIISDPRAKFDNGPGSFTGDSTARGIAIKLSDNWADGIVFDTDLMRVSAGWIDGPLQLRGLIADGAHGPGPTLGVPPLIQTPHLPGWAGPDGSLKDPRPNTIDPLPPPGPLPKTWAHYKGLYRHGDQVVLSYTVGGANVLEMPSIFSYGKGEHPTDEEIAAALAKLWKSEYLPQVIIYQGKPANLNEVTADFKSVADDWTERLRRVRTTGAKALVRTIRIDQSERPMQVVVADANPIYPFPGCQKPENIKEANTGKTTVADDGKSAYVAGTAVSLANAPEGARLAVAGSQLVLNLPAFAAPSSFQILFGRDGKLALDLAVNSIGQPVDLSAFTRGGPSLWKQEIVTQGKLAAKSDEPYVVDTLTLPTDNPWNAWIRPGGFAFFEDGTRAALSTWSGDVWVVSGIDEKLEKLTWKRVATGLHQPLGLAIVKGQIYTLGHDQITRLVDLDGDGETDFYENFNADWELTTAFHAFAFDLQADKDNGFVFAFGSPVHAGGGGFQKITNHHGTIMHVSPDGQKLDILGTGLRAPNGIGLNVATGQITSSDNQGTWVPVCPIHWVKPGDFLGVVDSAHKPMKSTKDKSDPAEQPKPLAWLPYPKVDNSGGGQTWVTSDRWGPFQGDLLHCSYGTSSLWKVMYEEVNGQMQGGVVKMPIKFTSSAMRPRFSPADGQLYVAGLKGWQTNAGADGGLDRVRYTGAPVRLPKSMRVLENGVAITFTTDLDPETANDAGGYAVEAWNVRWTGAYGSAEYKPSAPDQKGRDTWNVKSAKLQKDHRTVFLEIDGIRPVMLMSIDFDLKSADGKALKSTIYNTIHNLGKAAVTEGR